MEAPAELTAAGAAIDSKAAAWEGLNLQVVVDEGRLADPLASYEHRPGARTTEETIGGRSARVVAFPLEDGSSFAAAHFPEAEGRDALTISVTGRAEHGGDTPLRALRSVTFA